MYHPYGKGRLNAKFVIIAQGPAEAKDSIPVDVHDLKREMQIRLKLNYYVSHVF
jgi:hypothetical protein